MAAPGRPSAGLVAALAVAVAVLSPIGGGGASATSLAGDSAAAGLAGAPQPSGVAPSVVHGTEGPILPDDGAEGGGAAAPQTSTVVWRSLTAAQFRSRYAGVLPPRLGVPTPTLETWPIHGEGSASSYLVFRNADKTPVRFDPCTPVRVRINAPTSVHGNEAREAVRRLGLATGIAFQIGEPTSFVPTRSVRSTPGTDLVIAWATPKTSDFLDSDQLGTGGWNTVGKTVNGKVHWRIDTAFAVLDSSKDSTLAPGFGTGMTRGALLMHELAHALGVDHVNDRVQLMNPELIRRTTDVAWGAGDLAALRVVGRPAGCIPR